MLNRLSLYSGLLVVVFFAHCTGAFAQNDALLEQLGAIETDFLFTSKNEPIDVSDQYIVRRSARFTVFDGGAGYETWWLEFRCAGRPLFDANGGRSGNRLVVKCYDAKDQYLTEFTFEDNEYIYVDNERTRLYIHLFSLEQVPVLILKQTVRFDVVAF